MEPKDLRNIPSGMPRQGFATPNGTSPRLMPVPYMPVFVNMAAKKKVYSGESTKMSAGALCYPH